MDAVAGLNARLRDRVLVLQLAPGVNQLNHGDVDAHGLLQTLLNRDDLVGGLEVELLVGAGQSLRQSFG